MADIESMIDVLINDDELVEILARKMISQRMRSMRPNFSDFEDYRAKCLKKWRKGRNLTLDFAHAGELIMQDLLQWRDEINERYKCLYRPLINWLKSNIDRIGFDRHVLLALIENSQRRTFSQHVAASISDHYQSTVDRQTMPSVPILVRHISDNENLLQQLISGASPFWFLDSGYTNFLLDGKKLWHRLVIDHIHPKIDVDYWPANRLQLLPAMPGPWRREGRDILVVESSDHHHRVFNSNSKTWRRQVETDLRMYTDRNIVFKPKNLSRKDRVSVYDILKEEPDRWYCVISDSSAAAVEAIWLGIPVITLGQHITNPVARSSISDINDLYRGPVGDWLCALTYNQFTKRELIDGTAARILQDYHRV